jgi:hypothetical protein
VLTDSFFLISGKGLALGLRATLIVVSLQLPSLRRQRRYSRSTLWVTRSPGILVRMANEGRDVSGRFSVASQDDAVPRSLGIEPK